MRFAVIGDAVEAIFLVEAIHASPHHDVASCCVTGQLAAAFAARSIPLDLVSNDEEAILDATAESVIVAYADTETSIAMSRQVSQADRHVLAIPPDDASTAFSYELHLLLDESRYGIIPVSGRWYVDPAGQGPEQTDRTAIAQLSAEAGLDASQQQSIADLRVIDAMGGFGFAYDRVTGFDLPGADGRLLSRSITLASTAEEGKEPLPPGTFTFKADSNAQDVAFVLQTDQGAVPVPSALPAPESSVHAAAATAMVDRLVARLPNAEACQQGMSEFSNSLEIAGALVRSLRRRRTIDVYFDGISEKGVFKTQMTAIGCGVLGYAMFGLVAYLLFAQLFKPADWVLQIARALWIGPVVLFLCAQLLLPIARERASGAPADEDSADDPPADDPPADGGTRDAEDGPKSASGPASAADSTQIDPDNTSADAKSAD